MRCGGPAIESWGPAAQWWGLRKLTGKVPSAFQGNRLRLRGCSIGNEAFSFRKAE